MNWLARLKELEAARSSTPQNLQKDAFVGFVGAGPEPFQEMKYGESIFTTRIVLFMVRDLDKDEAEAMVDRLAVRDQEKDERRVCVECRHLFGTKNRRFCHQWEKTGKIGGPSIPSELTTILQRCAGFEPEVLE
ncbi:hypothetical protein [Noviherbaspirillum autotrophicum]|uniref:Uncharacterized protein n=1 Tax=Noviherbaspirillum autotrophicum TaxID=709839 RepID=A0A0C2BML6_9BURK|nr:hypothetical protein [Noviherbaspirillum autotrophicum]KIF82485.1 hypothetical protein TSA66_19365 [Noviherbaspirillum autotrophicum]